MTLPLPGSLSPSKVSAFTSCALAFRFATIDRLPEPPSPQATKGTLVHRALELLHWQVPSGERTVEAGLACLDQAWVDLQSDPELTGLGLSPDAEAAFRAEAAGLVRNYFRLEDPNQVRAVGVEVLLAARVQGVVLRGIIDRLDLDGDGELVVTDYKTGRAPSTQYEGKRLTGVAFYAFLCEAVLGRRPARVQLLHLQEPVAISTQPTDQSIRAMQQRTGAVWSAVTRACERDDFRPNPGPLCGWCNFKAWCPAFGGDPTQAAVDLRAAAVAVAV